MLAAAVGAGLILMVDHRVIVLAASVSVLACAVAAALGRSSTGTVDALPAGEASIPVEPVH
ncbi:MAG: hypothetical protein ACRDWI_17125 [Jiangellaceae bacterium]